MKQRLAKAGMLIGLTLAGMLGSASVAQAGQNASALYFAPDGALAASASFEALGEHVTVCDHKPDGHSAVGLFNGVPVWASGGSGTCTPGNLNILDGTWVWVEACVGERGSNSVLRCGPGSWGIA
jgi:hypothetical protein